ncbi:tyrosine-type recombinase/integrase [Clostridium gasigenes]|uniref:Phage integrase family protein n=1 Tax=Clostridium gasigenes TaxID=94869 RepID=A0A1H0M6L8_9CLOT|nr:tyrosine-type recombinase/integrase [Clostridium gasigenes]SDO76128.1 Phage integrase family protein [Clostridium gasigenes]
MAEENKKKVRKRRKRKKKEENKIKKKKVAANPIPEKQYYRFKDRLIELSKENKERNLMIFQIGIATGYRTGDIVDLTVAEILDAIEDKQFIIQEKKQFKAWKTYQRKKKDSDPDRKCPKPMDKSIEDNLIDLLEVYIEDKKRSEYAFLSNKCKNKHISSKSYSEILSKVGLSLKLENISGHSMRKTYAHRLYDDNRDLEFVRKNLNHRSIVTTQFYLGLESEAKKEAAKIASRKL